MKRFIIALILGITAWVPASTCHAQDSLERGLLKQAPKLIKYFQSQGYKNVGVLKFLVSREGKPFSDNVGAFNLLAARRLERALVIANDPRKPVGIVDNASDVARRINGANHLSAEGRRKLFTARYPLAWGTDSVEPDVFVTGTTEISKDRRMLTMTLYGFDRATAKLVPLGEDFQVTNATDRLSEMGDSFALRGLFDDGDTQQVGKPQGKGREEANKAYEQKVQAKVYEEATKVYEQKTQHPVQQAGLPVTLEVRYGGKKIPFEVKDGKAFIPEPDFNQTVEFGLKRDNSKTRYGVVLKVNGENTLEKQRLPDNSCQKWILDPGYGPWAIRGFQLGDSSRETFRVASLVESKQREVHYGHDVGTITMSVFKERSGNGKPKLLQDEELYPEVVKNLTELPNRPENYGALKAKLLDDANRGLSGTRGLIVSGNKEESKIQTVSFIADPNPIMTITIVYYRK